MSTKPGASPRQSAEPDTPSHRPVANRMVGRVLRSPLSAAVDGALMLITVHGRRTGQEISLPVQYAVGDDAIWVWPGHRRPRRGGAICTRSPGLVCGCAARTFTAAAESLPSRQSRPCSHMAAAPTRRASRVPAEPSTRPAEARPSWYASRCQRTFWHGHGAPGGRFTASMRRHPLGAYFLLSYLLSWSYWIPVALTGGHVSHFPGLMGPMLAALAVTAVVTGRAGLRELTGRMVRWRVPVRWYVASIVPLAAALLALVALRLAGRPLPTVDQLSDMPGLPTVGWWGVLALALLINGYGEETGWRGFAWPLLRERHSLAGAALILAVPWAVWHIPTFWLDTGMRGFPPFMIPGFLIGMAAGAVVLGWLYEHARASLLVIALWHATLNMASATEGTENVAAVTSTVVIIWAVLLTRKGGKEMGAG